MQDKKTFYITTPIYYPSAQLHIGNTYTTVAADTMARFKKMTGYDTYFLTGTDEHGQKIERRAQAAGKDPQVFVDEIVEDTKKLWKLMDVEYDVFMRTTQPDHIRAIQRIFRRMLDQDDIYKSTYEGQYCASCEAFWTETQLNEGGTCPDCGKVTELVQEESYFFRMSKYQDWLIQYIEDHPEFIQPPSRANEMLQNFLRPGLQDLCVSRTTFSWGVPVDFDPKHVVYVWIDALFNYVTALGYMSEEDTLLKRYWPAQVQLVGKDIVRFHTIYWPIMLHALGLPLPKQVFAHGWLLFGNDKMSKSKGNVVYPPPIVARYGADALRYYLMREMPFGADGNYTNRALLNRINSDLANDLGNLVRRTLAMIEKYFDGVIPQPGTYEEVDIALREKALALPAAFEREMDALQFSQALQEVWRLVSESNRYIDLTQPWVLGRDDAGKERLKTVLYVLAEAIRFIGVLIYPVMPTTSKRIHQQLGITQDAHTTWDSLQAFGALPAGVAIQPGEALFPRVDVEKELAELEADKGKEKPQPAPEPVKEEPAKAQIAFDDFEKISLKVARVLSCEHLAGSDKLLKFQLSLGQEERTVLSGIAKYHDPATLVGRKVILLTNLAPRKIRGVMSEGMLLSAENPDGSLHLLFADDDVVEGAEIG
jgi:methionyl-tRNA synthetase